ncbi:type IV secretory system conjugative DNA transfer family protein [Nocardiopsis exhalans]|uniref:Type IV secretory system conjugative DNA transfer family protein n=1 Tax=Nocardiopsis exhalans TaxID=163604 RepID=A0ABY5DCU5_9ACTN|nr:type IV secretory system conjugative DNA transfer family protein [Nocardiopsis exhalans]USY21318.1 type IV secretory system conjugative DNA transfer family protein [Nocardiopsis exhalans]
MAATPTSHPTTPLPPVRITPRDRVYLGLDPADGYKRVWSSPSDSVGLVGPPRYGKTSGIIIPALLYWSGPAVSTTTRGDILRFCGNWRRRVAAPEGEVYVYDPFDSEGFGREGLSTMRWSPLAGCADPAVCFRRVQGMTGAVGGLSDGEHWQSGAALILRALFHAAALGGAPMSEVRRWLAAQETRRPAQILRDHPTAASGWADDLESMRFLGERERGSFYSVARNCLDATAEPRVLDSCSAVDLDIDHFLATNSTLFIVGPSHYQAVVAPMIVGLVDSIAQRAAEVAALQGGRLRNPLLLALDEVANIAPLPSLPALVSEGGGRGVITLWAAQSLAQLRARYGADEQQAILTATTAKIIYGGMSNEADLRNVSSWGGELRQVDATTYGGGGEFVFPDRPSVTGQVPGVVRPGVIYPDAERQYSLSPVYRPALPIEAIQRMPPWHAWLWWQSEPPLHVETRPAGLIEEYQQVSGYTPAS